MVYRLVVFRSTKLLHAPHGAEELVLDRVSGGVGAQRLRARARRRTNADTAQTRKAADQRARACARTVQLQLQKQLGLLFERGAIGSLSRLGVGVARAVSEVFVLFVSLVHVLVLMRMLMRVLILWL